MVANRIPEFKFTDAISGTVYRFPYVVDKDNARVLNWSTRPWQKTDPQNDFRVSLGPWHGGLAQDRLNGRLFNYAKGPADTSYEGLLVPPPLVNSVTMASGGPGYNAVEFNSLVFIHKGQYIYTFNPSTGIVALDKDFGVAYTVYTMVVFDNELIVGLSSSTKIWKRSTGGVWTQATDNTYANAFATVDEKLWRAVGNLISSCLTTPLTLANWSPASGSEYEVGSNTYDVTSMIEYNGALWVGKADGLYQADPIFKFHNQTPQLKLQPHADNCKGMFVAHGSLWVPSAGGLYRIRLGKSLQYGPELTHRPGYQFWVRGGFEFRGDIYLLVTDQNGTENTSIIKMVRDPSDPNLYTYHELASLGGTSAGYFLTISTVGTNPQVIAGYANDLRWFKLGRGSSRHIDDSNYAFGTSWNLETGFLVPGLDENFNCILQGVDVLYRGVLITDTLSIQFLTNSGSFANLLSTQEGGGTANITSSSGYGIFTRYAPFDATGAGNYLNFKFIGTFTSATGTSRPEIRGAWAFGKIRPRKMDVLKVALIADGSSLTTTTTRSGITIDEAERVFRSLADNTHTVLVELERYEEATNTRFVVEDVQVTESLVTLGNGIEVNPGKILNVTLVRVPYANNYAS